MSLELYESITVAQELARELTYRPMPPTESEIKDAVRIMNFHLFATHRNDASLFPVKSTYVNLPDDIFDLEFVDPTLIEQSRIPNAVIRGKVDSFQWIGSPALSGFGIRLYGVDILAPVEQRAHTVFTPIGEVGSQLAA